MVLPWQTARRRHAETMLRRTAEWQSKTDTQPNYPRQGVIYGVLSYGLWGLVPLYFKLVASVPPIEVVAQRVFWSCLLLAILITLVRRCGALRRALRRRRTVLALTATTLLLAVN